MKKWFFVVAVAISNLAIAQLKFSISTDVSLLRNYSPKQHFSVLGQTVQATFHPAPKENFYAWIGYYTKGNFSNDFTAQARGPLTLPQSFNFTASGSFTYRHLSLGWKHYFKGSYNTERNISFYGLAGFGFLFSKASNSFSKPVDVALYATTTSEGSGEIKRLTFDAGLGVELPLASNFFLYSDLRTWLPASGNNLPYLHSQKNVPLPVMLSAGLRVLFELGGY